MVLAIEGLAIEVTPRRSIHLLVGYIAFVFVKSLLCFPLSFSNINPGWALITDDFVDHIYCFTIVHDIVLPLEYTQYMYYYTYIVIYKVATYRHVYRHEPKEPCHFVSLSGSEIHQVSVLFPIRYSIRVTQQDSAFKMTHIEAKSIYIWLRYDPKHLGSILSHISAKY